MRRARTATLADIGFVIVLLIVGALAIAAGVSIVGDQRACRALGGQPMTDRFGNTVCFNVPAPR
jgi:hypothetical protein